MVGMGSDSRLNDPGSLRIGIMVSRCFVLLEPLPESAELVRALPFPFESFSGLAGVALVVLSIMRTVFFSRSKLFVLPTADDEPSDETDPFGPLVLLAVVVPFGTPVVGVASFHTIPFGG